MLRALRPLLATLLLASASAAGAQSNVVAPPPPPREGTVGPEQLRDFSLGGNREQPAAQTPAQPPATPPAADRTPASETAALPRPAPAERTSAPGAARPATNAPATSAASAGVASVALPPAAGSAAASGFEAGSATPAPPSAAVPAPTPFVPAPLPTDSSASFPSLWPWLLALLAAAAGVWFFLRRRSEQQADPGRLAFAGVAAPAGDAPPLPTPQPRPAPAPQPTPTPRASPPAAAPQPEPAPTPAPSGGIVSTRLRAWLDNELAVRAVVLTDDELQIHFDLLLTNSGSVPARDIAIEALVLNAGPEQEADLAAFYARPDGAAFAADLLPPLGKLPLQPTVRMARSAFREYAVGGGQAVVPILALNIGYRAGGAHGRSSAAFLVGPPAKGSDKLAPFRTDEGPRSWSPVVMRGIGEFTRR